MGRWWVAALALTVGACVSPQEERLRDYGEIGTRLYAHGQFREARDTFQAAVALKSDDPHLLYNLGQCHDQLEDYPRARKAYEECLRLSPNHAEGWHALTVLLVRTGNRAEAVARVEGWLKAEPKLGAAYAEDGWLRADDGDLINARGRFQQALMYDPTNNQALIGLARIYAKTDHANRAAALYERALAAHPDQPEVRDALTALRTNGAGRPRPE
jgi:tetratricopeptide (TPR) repeat protein